MEHRELMRIQWNWKIGMCMTKGCAFLQKTGILIFFFLYIKQHSYYIVTNLFSVNFAAQQRGKVCGIEH